MPRWLLAVAKSIDKLSLGVTPARGRVSAKPFLAVSDKSLGRIFGQGTVKAGTAPSSHSFLYSRCPAGRTGWGCAWAGAEGGMSRGCAEARCGLAAVTEQAVVLVFCLSPAFGSADAEVVPTVPSLASAGSPWQHGGMLCPRRGGCPRPCASPAWPWGESGSHAN